MVSGASSLAKKFKVSEIVIGLTVVALGTSAPELVVNIISGTTGHNEVVFGNIIGSNIFNVFLILGISGVIYPLHVQKSTLKRELPFSLLMTFLLFFLVNDVLFGLGEKNRTSLFDGVLLLFFFALFLISIFSGKDKEPPTKKNDNDIKVYPPWETALRIIGGLTGLVFGGKFVVDNAVSIAETFEVSEKMIGLTIIAAGTSLPELATSAMAAYKKSSDIAMGNVIGSNIFNILLVLGSSTVISPLAYNTELNIDLFILMGGTVMLLIFMFTSNKRRLDRLEASLFLLVFIAYMIYLFMRQ